MGGGVARVVGHREVARVLGRREGAEAVLVGAVAVRRQGVVDGLALGHRWLLAGRLG
jgi:hypothetical protein